METLRPTLQLRWLRDEDTYKLILQQLFISNTGEHHWTNIPIIEPE